MKHVNTKTGGICGILAAIVFIIFTALAVVNYPDYSPYTAWLSDLGVGETALFFNLGLILAGIMGLMLSISLYNFKARLTTLGTTLLLLVDVFLIGVGIFTEDYGVLHTYVSFIFFILAGLALLVLGAGMIKMRAGQFTFLMGIAMAIIYSILGVQPISEFILVAVIIFWSFVFGAWLLKKKF